MLFVSRKLKFKVLLKIVEKSKKKKGRKEKIGDRINSTISEIK